MATFSINFIANIILNFIAVLLHLATFTYISHLEETGCKCADHKNKNFIKGFALFAMIYLLVTMAIPTDFIINSLGPVIAILFGIVQVIFIIMTIVYLFMVLDYTRYLINQKCKCSDDFRREIIMFGSIIEIFLVIINVINFFILPLILINISTAFKNLNNAEAGMRGIITDPVRSLKNVPRELSNTTKSLSKIVKTTAQGVKNFATKKRDKLISMKSLKGKR